MSPDNYQQWCTTTLGQLYNNEIVSFIYAAQRNNAPNNQQKSVLGNLQIKKVATKGLIPRDMSFRVPNAIGHFWPFQNYWANLLVILQIIHP